MLSVTQLTVAGDVEIQRDPDDDTYQVTVVLQGFTDVTRAGATVTVGAESALVHRPGEKYLMHCPAGSSHLLITIERRVVDREVEHGLGRPAIPAAGVRPPLSLRRGPGRSWGRLLRQLSVELHDDATLLHHPTIAQHWAAAIVTGLIVTAGIRPGSPPGGTRVVRRTTDAIQKNPAHPFDLHELAAIAGCSPRGLQEAFHRELGTTPLQYLRTIRLERSHAELLRSTPAQVTVADVAFRWGFTHLGRFAAQYRRHYGTLPSHTLRRC